MKPTVLIVDDDSSVTTSLGLLLKRHGYLAVPAASQEEALEVVRGRELDLVLQDMNFSRATTGEEGMELLAAIRRLRPGLPVILITAWGSIQLAVDGIKAGASDFITKPWSNAQLLQAVETALSLAAARVAEAGEGRSTREELDRRGDFRAIIGNDPRFLKLLELVARVAPTDASVLITGESGTGKELVAEALHHNSRRRDHPFVKVNLGGISSTLFESEMFGHVRGAFTDARADRKGRFEIADGGTIFLDEIGELDHSSQVKLLRVLQDRTFEVLGSSRSREVDVRVVSATNRALTDMVSRGEFREDLLYRINLLTIHLPPLRERPDDIPVLASRFLQTAGQIYRRGPLTLADAARRWLRAQPWPGNVRQLRQCVERAVLVSTHARLDVEDFSESVQPARPEPGTDALPPVGSMTMD